MTDFSQEYFDTTSASLGVLHLEALRSALATGLTDNYRDVRIRVKPCEAVS